MKQKILIVLIFLNGIAFSQQKQFNIVWESSKSLFTGSYTINTPSFNPENFVYNDDEGLLFIAQWPCIQDVDESSIRLSQIKYSTISTAELLDLEVSRIPTKLKFSLKNSKGRDKQFAFFQLSPIIKDKNGNFKKITTFQINYTDLSIEKRGSFSSKTFGNSKTLTNSVLNTGNWYKFYVDTTGVFKLNKNFLERLGVNVNNIDPRSIKIYGNGGGMIPYSNAVGQPYDVTENAIKFVGENDGVFNNEDYILFYAVGPKGYNIESDTNINCYTDKTYYYINVGSGNGKRIKPMVEPTAPADLIIDTYQDYAFHEQDIHNLGTLGRRWFGDRFDIENEKTFTFNFPDLVTTVPLNVKALVASVSSTRSTMDVKVNGNLEATLSLTPASGANIASGASYNRNLNVSASKVEVTLTYNNQGNPSALGYLDYISITATRQLRFNDKQFQFENLQVASLPGIGQYVVSNASKVSEVWDVTDIFNVTHFDNTNSNSDLSFKATLGTKKTYVALTPSDYFDPKIDSNKIVRNQNLKGTVFLNSQGDFQDIDYVIIAPNSMIDQAQRLAEINRKQYNLNVKVFGLTEIYNEFSTGNQDIGALRNFVKYIYDNASAPENRIKYLCLFGDASYDYKDRIPNNTNIVPSWYSYNSFSFTASFVSDDFFGMMDDNEGTMITSDRLDIAIGRILAETPKRAKEMVDKVESYYTKASSGRWRNNYVVVSDDVDEDWEGILQETTDNVGNLVTQNKPFINVIKIHSDAFQQESTAGGEAYPDATNALVNAVNNGALVVNYFGHGGEDGLSSERLLLKTHINDFINLNKLNCFITVTCEFTKFDNPFRETAGELSYWNPKAGAIGLISTTRQVFVTFGIVFNNTLGQYLFSYSDNDTFEDYEYPTIAEALRLTKNDPSINNSIQRRLVFFIGDPAMKLAFSEPSIKLTKLNDVPLAQATDTLKALSKIKISGEVTDFTGNILNDYSGILSTTIYDKFLDEQTLANDGTRLRGDLIKLDFTRLGEVIYRGQASVTNGQFEFDFVVPKDIRIPVGVGKVSFYSKNEALLINKGGAESRNIKIGGINENAEVDNTGPVITLFMNDENFVSGGITNESPTLLAKLEDTNGINTASGIGHDIVAIIDGDETNPFVLNDFYQTEVDDFQKGIVSFPFRDLEPGIHTLTLKAWDVYNNSGTAEIQFVVFDKDQDLVINNVLNYPNPFINYTEFWFNHNSSAPLDVSIQIFTVSGKLVRTLNGQTAAGGVTASSLSKDIVWDGRDDFGDKIGKGVYIYKLTVRSSTLNKTVEKIEKLVIL